MASASRSTKLKVAIVFGLAVVVALVVTAVTSGFGDPAIEDGEVAVVDGVDDGTVTQEQLDTALTQSAVSLGLKKAPPPDDPQYPSILDQSMQSLLQSIWVEAEAADRGVEVSPEDVDAELEKTKQQNFGGNEKQFNDYLERSDLTIDEAKEQISVSLLTNALVADVAPGNQNLPKDIQLLEPEAQLERLAEFYGVDDRAVETYYESAKDLPTSEGGFKEPPTREARVILNTSEKQVQEAATMLEEGGLSDEVWKKVAAKYSQDQTSKSTGGQLPAPVIEGGGSPFESQVFEAPEGELFGPFETDRGFAVLEVTKATEETVTPLDDKLTKQIQAVIVTNRQQQEFEEFKADFFEKWTQRTICDPEATVLLCSNFEPPVEEPVDDPATPEDEAAIVPPAVQSTQPIAPGTAAIPLSYPSGYVPPLGDKPQGPAAGVQLDPAGALPPGSVPIGPDGQPVVPGATGATGAAGSDAAAQAAAAQAAAAQAAAEQGGGSGAAPTAPTP